MRRVSGFTLVELLVVIAIMIIIMGFSVPMFSKISFGNAVDGASRMISSQLSLARAQVATVTRDARLVAIRKWRKMMLQKQPSILKSGFLERNGGSSPKVPFSRKLMKMQRVKITH